MLVAQFQPPADLVEQVVLLAVDLTAGLIVGAPGLVALAFENPYGALPPQLFWERWCEASLSTLSEAQRLVSSYAKYFAWKSVRPIGSDVRRRERHGDQRRADAP